MAPWRVVQHLFLAIVGGYFLAAGLAAFMALVLAGLMPLSEAGALMAMLSFPIYLAVLLWALSERRPARLWWVLGLGGPVIFGLPLVLSALVGTDR